MKENRRLKRMQRASKRKKVALNLVSLMDVFTILVFFLLVNSSTSEVLEPPREIKLPDSIVESKPRETVIVLITGNEVLIQGDVVATTDEVIAYQGAVIETIRQRLLDQQKKIIGIRTKAVAESMEVTVLADRALPFKLLKKVMSSCTAAGYSKISLAINQKAAHQA